MVTGLLCPLAAVPVGWFEALFGAFMLVPLLFFLVCALYLWRLLLFAIPLRSRLAVLTPPQVGRGELLTSDGLGAAWDASETVNAGPPPEFIILIPAHDEELVLGTALDSLRGLDYPSNAYRIVVIADNCTDRTAEIAREHGAEAEERHDQSLIGKGYALAWMLERLRNAEQSRRWEQVSVDLAGPVSILCGASVFDAVVILDADTLVAPNLLRVFAENLKSGECAVQARYEVLNVSESWRTRLMSCALALAHIVKPLGRESLLLSDGLKGNGMCFTRSVVESVPWSGESITEDIDYTIHLCRAGYRVAFAPETAVWAQMPTTAKQSASQRQRWEGGRYRLICQVAPALFAEGVRKRSRVLLDRAVELIIPPFAEMFAVPCVMLIVCVAASQALHLRLFATLAIAWSAVLLLQAGYLIGGMWLARIPLSVAVTALYAPGYILWKFGLYGAMLVQRSAGGWKRTERRKLDG
jgi:1,2-diacylglycerol 3-beta-glucosyltransferase